MNSFGINMGPIPLLTLGDALMSGNQAGYNAGASMAARNYGLQTARSLDQARAQYFQGRNFAQMYGADSRAAAQRYAADKGYDGKMSAAELQARSELVGHALDQTPNLDPQSEQQLVDFFMNPNTPLGAVMQGAPAGSTPAGSPTGAPTATSTTAPTSAPAGAGSPQSIADVLKSVPLGTPTAFSNGGAPYSPVNGSTVLGPNGTAVPSSIAQTLQNPPAGATPTLSFNPSDKVTVENNLKRAQTGEATAHTNLLANQAVNEPENDAAERTLKMAQANLAAAQAAVVPGDAASEQRLKDAQAALASAQAADEPANSASHRAYEANMGTAAIGNANAHGVEAGAAAQNANTNTWKVQVDADKIPRVNGMSLSDVLSQIANIDKTDTSLSTAPTDKTGKVIGKSPRGTYPQAEKQYEQNEATRANLISIRDALMAGSGGIGPAPVMLPGFPAPSRVPLGSQGPLPQTGASQTPPLSTRAVKSKTSGKTWSYSVTR